MIRHFWQHQAAVPLYRAAARRFGRNRRLRRSWRGGSAEQCLSRKAGIMRCYLNKRLPAGRPRARHTGPYRSRPAQTQNIPGWQSSARQKSLQRRKPHSLGLVIFRMDRFAGVMPISSANSPAPLWRRAIIIQIDHNGHRAASLNRVVKLVLHVDGLGEAFFSTRTRAP